MTTKGQTILITGGTDGIGLALAQRLGEDNRLLIIGRSKEKLTQYFWHEKKVRTYVADLSSMEEVKTVSNTILSDIDGIDLLIHNASCVSSARIVTNDGFEMQLAVNYLAPVLLTAKLLPLLKRKQGTILFINSRAHKRVKFDISDLQLAQDYSLSKSYNRSKLYLVMYAKRLSELLVTEGVKVQTVHPGLVNTKMGEKQCNIFHRTAWIVLKHLGKSPKCAANNIVRIIGSYEFRETSGCFFGPNVQETPASVVRDHEAKHNLWVLTEKTLQTSIL
ncbi:MAG: SDR family NAD(P)-dependent oxidoreductase [Flavobacteriales bacterium]|nr:SDR family NAD(P)-dependent oxidoreductase [Flavobacteriales bacterium]